MLIERFLQRHMSYKKLSYYPPSRHLWSVLLKNTNEGSFLSETWAHRVSCFTCYWHFLRLFFKESSIHTLDFAGLFIRFYQLLEVTIFIRLCVWMVYFALNPPLVIIGSGHRKLFQKNMHASITSSTIQFLCTCGWNT